jgi:hypothetical protein
MSSRMGSSVSTRLFTSALRINVAYHPQRLVETGIESTTARQSEHFELRTDAAAQRKVS